MRILAGDFGGTTIKLGLVQDGCLAARSQLEARAVWPMSDRLEAAACEWEKLLKNHEVTLADCEAAVLGLPFIIDAGNSRVLGEFGKFPGATDIRFDEWSRARLGLPVTLENDLRLALLGEWTSGAAQGMNNVVMLALGTGIGCAVISAGHLLRGANNRATTLLGHGTVARGKAIGRCGNMGCAEDLASTATLAVRAKARHDFAGSRLAHVADINYEALFRFADEGDACSRALRQESLEVWSVMVQNAVIAYDPEIVVLGGGVLRRHDTVLPAVKQHIRQYMPSLALETPVVAAALGDDAALLGGEALLKQNSVHFSV